MAEQVENIVGVNRARGWSFAEAQRKSPLSAAVIVGTTELVDFCLPVLGALLALAIRSPGEMSNPETLNCYALTVLLGAVLFLFGFHRAGGYAFKQLAMLRWQITRVSIVWAGAMSLLLTLAFVSKTSQVYSRGWALAWIAATLGLFCATRLLLFAAIDHWSRTGRLTRNLVIVGAGQAGERLAARLRATRAAGICVLGFFDDRRTRVPSVVEGWEVLGTTDDLIDFARKVPIDEVIVALPLEAEQRVKLLFEKLQLLPADLRLSAERIAHILPVRGVSYIGDVPLVDIVERPLKDWGAVAKWLEDKLLSVVILVLLAPLMAIIALLIKLDSAGPVLFAQDRFGLNNKVIRVLKFRTMYVDKGDASGAQRSVRNDKRVTRIGRLLRATSLDELPQLLNVLRGDMSLVGPRPHATAMRAGDQLYHDAVEEYVRRHRVKPGITGWAQINGLRGEIDTLDKARARVAYDLHYIERWSLWLDLKILIISVGVVFNRENAY